MPTATNQIIVQYIAQTQGHGLRRCETTGVGYNIDPQFRQQTDSYLVKRRLHSAWAWLSVT